MWLPQVAFRPIDRFPGHIVTFSSSCLLCYHTVIAHSVIYIADHQRKSSLNRFQLPFPRKVKGDAEVQSVYTLQDDLLK